MGVFPRRRRERESGPNGMAGMAWQLLLVLMTVSICIVCISAATSSSSTTTTTTKNIIEQKRQNVLAKHASTTTQPTSTPTPPPTTTTTQNTTTKGTAKNGTISASKAKAKAKAVFGPTAVMDETSLPLPTLDQLDDPGMPLPGLPEPNTMFVTHPSTEPMRDLVKELSHAPPPPPIGIVAQLPTSGSSKGKSNSNTNTNSKNEKQGTDSSGTLKIVKKKGGKVSVIDVRALPSVRDFPMGQAPPSVNVKPIHDILYDPFRGYVPNKAISKLNRAIEAAHSKSKSNGNGTSDAGADSASSKTVTSRLFQDNIASSALRSTVSWSWTMILCTILSYMYVMHV
jgi:hypothetical protein